MLTACDKEPVKVDAPAAPVKPVATPVTPPVIKGDVELDVEKPMVKPAHAQAALDLGSNKAYIAPIQHGTFYMQWGRHIVYVDPVTPAMQTLPADKPAPKADIVLLTDIHPDHMDAAAVKSLLKPNTIVVAPKAVAEKIKGQVEVTHVIANGQEKALKDTPFTLRATPMYNIKRTKPDSDTPFHTKGRGNGYIVTHKEGGKVYVSGDTECTPEMRALEGIDLAFVTMNLPYTMPVEEAAECIRAFKPKRIVPFHHRGQEIAKLEQLLKDTPEVKLHLFEWYPKAKEGDAKTEDAH